MPKKLHEALKKAAKKKFGTTKSERAEAYIYGTLNKQKKAEKEKRK